MTHVCSPIWVLYLSIIRPTKRNEFPLMKEERSEIISLQNLFTMLLVFLIFFFSGPSRNIIVFVLLRSTFTFS